MINRPIARILLRRGAACGVIALAACAGPDVIPGALLQRVDRTLEFTTVQRDPGGHTGSLLVLGGSVLTVRALEGRTRLELLELPVNDNLEPSLTLAESRGRFLAYHAGFFDPAFVPPGTRITLVGEVTGAQTMSLDEATYTYPTLAVQHMMIWAFPGSAQASAAHLFVGWPWGWYERPYPIPPRKIIERAR